MLCSFTTGCVFFSQSMLHQPQSLVFQLIITQALLVCSFLKHFLIAVLEIWNKKETFQACWTVSVTLEFSENIPNRFICVCQNRILQLAEWNDSNQFQFKGTNIQKIHGSILFNPVPASSALEISMCGLARLALALWDLFAWGGGPKIWQKLQPWELCQYWKRWMAAL